MRSADGIAPCATYREAENLLLELPPHPAGKQIIFLRRSDYGSSRMTRPVCVSGVQLALAVMKLYGPLGTIES